MVGDDNNNDDDDCVLFIEFKTHATKDEQTARSID